MSRLHVLVAMTLSMSGLTGTAQEVPETPCEPSGEMQNLGVISVAEMIARLPSDCPPPSPEDYEMGLALAYDALKSGRPLDRKVPRIFRDFQAPQDLVFVGSATARRETTAVYATSMTADEATRSMVSGLEGIGWEPYRPWSANGPVNVHIIYPVVCRDSQVVSVIPQAFDTYQYVLLSFYHEPTNCDGERKTPTLRTGER